MKKTFVRALALVLAAIMGLSLVTVAFAAPSETQFTVRVNGKSVVFPDAQPFVDENWRTLVPVRFVTEQLGANVSWRQADQTAIIEKNGITVEIAIGSPTLRVTNGGKTSTVTMDTAAVGRDGRTYVPIRFVAEALGAFVDYSNEYHVVGIYQDVLSVADIERLQAYDYTLPSSLTFKGPRTGDFANAREQLYNGLIKAGERTKYFPQSNVYVSSKSEDFFSGVVDEVVATLNIDNDAFYCHFVADESCIYSPDPESTVYTVVRGIATVEIKKTINDLSGDEIVLLGDDMQMDEFLYSGIRYTFDYDVYVNNNGRNNYVRPVGGTRLCDPY